MRLYLFILLISTLAAHAKLTVKIDDTKTVGKKSAIKLTMKNTFQEKIQSARAQIFLLNDEGKVVGQTVKWVIGGTKDRPALDSNAETVFNFVIETEKPFTKTQLSFTKIILEGGKLADPKGSYEVVGQSK